MLLEGDAVAYADDVCIGTEDIEAIRTLLAATEPPTDEEIAQNVGAVSQAEAFAARDRALKQDHKNGVTLLTGALLAVRRLFGTPEGK